MEKVLEHTIETTVKPDAIWKLWADPTTWPQWDGDTVWARLDGPFAVGVTGKVKPKGFPAGRIAITSVTPGVGYSSMASLPGGQMCFEQEMETEGDVTRVTHRISFAGPLSWLWFRLLSPAMRRDLPEDLARLTALASAES